MGAHNIEFDLNDCDFDEVQQAFRQRQESDGEENGHQSGYSGDFQTVNEVKNELHKVFESYSEAHEYCMNTAQKWDFVVAVRYKVVEGKDIKYPKSIGKLEEKIKALNTTRNDLYLELTSQSIRNTEGKKVLTCKECKSKYKAEYLHTAYDKLVRCPLCGASFGNTSTRKQVTKIAEKVELLEGKIKALKATAKAKAAAKSTKTKILVAGWGAC